MIRKIFSATVASAAIFIAGPAMAGPGHSGGPHGGGGRADTLSGPMGAAHANSNSSMDRLETNVGTRIESNIPTTNPATSVSQGLLHASPNGIAHASPNSVLGRAGVQGTTLPGLTTGLNVLNSNGTTIGQVSQIVTDRSGNVRLVIVTDSSTGQTFRLAPNTLSISGSTVTTTSTTGG